MADSELHVRMAQTRAVILAKKWANCQKLSPGEFAECKHLLPADATAEGRTFAGVPEPITAAPARVKYSFPLAHYEKLFETKKRALKDMIADGKRAMKEGRAGASLPPFDDPPRMARWWVIHRTQRVPDKLLRLELEERQGKTPGASAGINVGALEIVEGEAMRQANSFLAAAGKHLEDAYASGDDAMIDRCTRRWEKAVDSKSKAERSEVAAAKARGDAFSRPEVIAELSQFLSTLRIMRSTMKQKMRRRVGNAPAEFLRAMDLGIDAEFAEQETFLRRLKYLRSLEDAQLELEREPA